MIFGTTPAIESFYLSNMRVFLILLMVSLLGLTAAAQYDCDSTVFFAGKVTSEAGRPLYDAMVVNRTRQVGKFCDSDGSFLIKICKDDTIQIGATGFATIRISFTDSLPKSRYFMHVRLKSLKVNIPEVTVLAPRDLNRIQEDINQLGFDERDYRTSGVNALESPITFLYEAFSRRERSRRFVAEMRNNDRRRELLKELFAKYVEYDIIALNDEEFDSFIDFMDPGDESLKRFSQYDFIIYVKESFAAYRRYGRRLHDSDYDYHRD